jgi:hypothetical protein
VNGLEAIATVLAVMNAASIDHDIAVAGRGEKKGRLAVTEKVVQRVGMYVMVVRLPARTTGSGGFRDIRA